jgi:hypothetical protein
LSFIAEGYDELIVRRIWERAMRRGHDTVNNVWRSTLTLQEALADHSEELDQIALTRDSWRGLQHVRPFVEADQYRVCSGVQENTGTEKPAIEMINCLPDGRIREYDRTGKFEFWVPKVDDLMGTDWLIVRINK